MLTRSSKALKHFRSSSLSGRHSNSCGMHSSGVAGKTVGNGWGGGFFGVYMSGPRGIRCARDADEGLMFTAANCGVLVLAIANQRYCSHLLLRWRVLASRNKCCPAIRNLGSAFALLRVVSATSLVVLQTVSQETVRDPSPLLLAISCWHAVVP